ncbi:uncharacterized protein LOC127095301 [Lathyrus oleraceus]|uniref:uncharacterized protein LOC127095301 n=1 Tax=Pisum sativum TaxID=3888 RepID=UPI0021D3554A|nr:uncharacterized protein LOC127095301 [Pisum sativum]
MSVEKEPERVTGKILVRELVVGDEQAPKANEVVEKEKPYVPPPPYKLLIHYPHRLSKSKTDEILSNKRKLDDDSTMELTEECSTIIHNKIPPKLKDPMSFLILCVIGDLKPTQMSLQLAHRSIKYLVGILEDILVRIDQLYIPIDFVVMDINENSNIPIFLGRPFLATTGVIVHVKRGKLTFEVGEENIEFILSYFMKAPAINDTCCFVDIIDECLEELSLKALPAEEPVAPLTLEVKDLEAQSYLDEGLEE